MGAASCRPFRGRPGRAPAIGWRGAPNPTPIRRSGPSLAGCARPAAPWGARSPALTAGFEPADQGRGRGIVRDARAAIQLGQRLRGQGLAQLDAPLVEAVEAPEHALDE